MDAVHKHIVAEFDETVVPALVAYVSIPSQSPDYDPEWQTNGLILKALKVQMDWVKKQGLKNYKMELVEEPMRTPCLIIEIEGTTPTKHTMFMYGHSDKQPPLHEGWDEGLGPYTPVYRDGKLYGRGAADDGYSIFSAVLSIAALQKNNIPHARTVILIETGEESGSPDIEYYIKEKFVARLGDVNMIVCLDSGCQSYDRLWLTSSLRGVAAGVLRVKVLNLGLHSGSGGGVVHDSFRIARNLLERVEDAYTGKILVSEAFCPIPEDIKKSMQALKEVDFKAHYPTIKSLKLPSEDNYELGIKNFWEPAMTVVGANLPPVEIAGNVIRSYTDLKISVRIPPAVDANLVLHRFKEILEVNPPCGAEVTFTAEASDPGQGFAAPPMEKWLTNCLNNASNAVYGKDYAVSGEGGSIPFMGMLRVLYPKAQFVVLGVLGAGSNAHGPNEMLHVPYCKGVTTCVSHVCAEHYKHSAN